MQDNYFTLIERLAPDLAQEIERRALVLERIGALQPVGRRQLAARLNLPEREVRTVATLLKEHGLVSLDAAGMSLTQEASDILPMARLFSRELRGLTKLETALSARWNGTKVCVVPGDAIRTNMCFTKWALSGRAAAELPAERLHAGSDRRHDHRSGGGDAARRYAHERDGGSCPGRYWPLTGNAGQHHRLRDRPAAGRSSPYDASA